MYKFKNSLKKVLPLQIIVILSILSLNFYFKKDKVEKELLEYSETLVLYTSEDILYTDLKSNTVVSEVGIKYQFNNKKQLFLFLEEITAELNEDCYSNKTNR